MEELLQKEEETKNSNCLGARNTFNTLAPTALQSLSSDDHGEHPSPLGCLSGFLLRRILFRDLSEPTCVHCRVSNPFSNTGIGNLMDVACYHNYIHSRPAPVYTNAHYGWFGEGGSGIVLQIDKVNRGWNHVG